MGDCTYISDLVWFIHQLLDFLYHFICHVIHSKYCNTFILPSERLASTPIEGNIAVISQSGGFLVDQIFSKFSERQIGIHAAANIGNAAVINEITLLKYFNQDKNVKSMVLYSEGFKENSGKELVKLSKSSNKDIIIIKGGKSNFGANAAKSHTASIASNLSDNSSTISV